MIDAKIPSSIIIGLTVVIVFSSLWIEKKFNLKSPFYIYIIWLVTVMVIVGFYKYYAEGGK